MTAAPLGHHSSDGSICRGVLAFGSCPYHGFYGILLDVCIMSLV